MPTSEIKVHAFTLKANGRLNVIHTPVEIRTPATSVPFKIHKTRGIWDTGASHTVITQKIVDELALKPIGITKVNTASESNVLAEKFLVNIALKDDLIITDVQVTVGKISPDIDCLIGMDIINLGDFSITNHLGKTCMSFRLPSLHEIDYIKTSNAKSNQPLPEKVGRNDPCPCGSGKKYKKCHGK